MDRALDRSQSFAYEAGEYHRIACYPYRVMDRWAFPSWEYLAELLISLVRAHCSRHQFLAHEAHPLTRKFPAWTRHRTVLATPAIYLEMGWDQIRTNQGGKLARVPAGSSVCVLNS